ncbi:DMT family transporter [Pseudohaliea rubra]|uniref:Permease of the drug/metabolite transporter (DMT) superfamily n=1 Tax=Pseudohaliea rubra DSM 19751 TaxID=1265313 RepID=A0A095X2B6_9GAMM|nr:DMT family transporter [Pseudohaliea rubra]KGE05014.1 Permease of the drug/metabolite transporter (DMT) superfamily [Pseudohaliea rubra DSM 19751]
MSATDTLRLLLLSSLWGFSFIFMRVAVLEFGPVSLIGLRMGLGALLLLPLLASRHHLRLCRQHARQLIVLGVFTSALPYSLLALATLGLEAGFTSLINAATPIATALMGVAFFATPILRAQVIGLTLALAGVAVLSVGRLDFSAGGDGWFMLAALAATLCYGFGGNYSRTRLAHLPSRVLAAGSCSVAAIVLLVPTVLLWPTQAVSPMAWGSALGLAALSTAAALLLYFRLLSSAGATAASTVTMLVPVSALAWGVVLLDESITPQMLAGMTATLLGTAIATGVLPLRRRRTLPG